MNVFKLIQYLYSCKTKQYRLRNIFVVAGLTTTTLLLLEAPTIAEGSYQLELRDETNSLPTNTNYSQGLLEYDSSYQSGAAGLPLRDRPLYVDVLNSREVINVSACGKTQTDDIRVQIYYHAPGTFEEYTDSPPTGTLVLDTGTLANGNVACNSPFNTRITNPLVRYNTDTSTGGRGVGTYEVRLYNLQSNGNNGVLDRFDVTITNSTLINPDPRENQGRLWSYVWGFRSGSFDETHAADTNYYIKVPSGFGTGNYVWKLDLNDFSGNAYEIVANQLGVDSPNADGDNVAGLSVPLENNSLTPQYKQYLSYPEDSTPSPAIVPTVENFRFEDNEGVDITISPNTTTNVQDSGVFKFTTDFDGTYSIIIDTSDGSDGGPDGIYGAGDVKLLGTASGDTEVPWDGKDNLGNVLPEGSYTVKLEVRVGEYHFVATDAETSGGDEVGLTLFRANSNISDNDTRVFWDDITGLPSATEGTTTLSDGALSSTIAGKHTWGGFETDGSGFGDRRFIDTYVFGSSAESQTPAIIAETDSQYGDYGDAPVDYDDTAGGGTIDSNDSPAVHSIDSTLYFGSVSPDSELGSQSSSAANGDDDATSPDVDDEDGISNFPNLDNTDESYSLTATVSNASDSPANVYAWIDFDRDGEFDQDERATVADGSITLDGDGKVPTGSSGTVTLNWSNLGGTGADLVSGDTYVRIRLTTDEELDITADIDSRDDASVGAASDGEVEDYPIAIASSTYACPTAKADLWFANDESGSVSDVEFVDALNFLYQLSDEFIYDDVTGVKAGVTAWANIVNSIEVVMPITESFGDSGDSGPIVITDDTTTPISTTPASTDGDGRGIRELYDSRQNTNTGTRLDYATNYLADLIEAGNGRRVSTPQIAILLTDAFNLQLSEAERGGGSNWIAEADRLRTTGPNGTRIVLIVIEEAANAYNNDANAKATIDSVVGEDGTLLVVPTYEDAADRTKGYIEIVSQAICDVANIPIASDPNLLLVKRITAINPGQRDEIRFDSFVNDDGNNNGDFNDDPDNDPNWPDDDDTYLPGATTVADIKPEDEVEYTIYFLSNGDEPATNVKICDVIPDNMSFVENAYDVEVGMALGLNDTTLPTEPDTTLSNAADTDEGTFYAPGTAPPTVTIGDPPQEQNLCSKVTTDNTTVSVGAAENINGAIVVEIDSVPESTAPGAPVNSYGFIRFRAEVQ